MEIHIYVSVQREKKYLINLANDPPSCPDYMVFNVLAQNCDDHTKNFAFRLKKDSNWELTPAYDICHAYSPDSQWLSQHALSINGKRKNIMKNDLSTIAKSMNIKKADKIITEINVKVALWNNYADETKVSSVLRDSINATLII